MFGIKLIMTNIRKESHYLCLVSEKKTKRNITTGLEIINYFFCKCCVKENVILRLRHLLLRTNLNENWPMRTDCSLAEIAYS